MDLGSHIPYDPIAWREAALRDPRTDPRRRQQLADETLIWRAEFIAHGCAVGQDS